MSDDADSPRGDLRTDDGEQRLSDLVVAALLASGDTLCPVSPRFAADADEDYGAREDDSRATVTTADPIPPLSTPADPVDHPRLNRVVPVGDAPQAPREAPRTRRPRVIRAPRVRPDDELPPAYAPVSPTRPPAPSRPPAAQAPYSDVPMAPAAGPRWPLIGLAAALVVLIAVTAVWFARRPDRPVPEPDAAAANVVTSTTTATNARGTVRIRSMTSNCGPGSADPSGAFDNNPSTAWVCIPAPDGSPPVLHIEFDGRYLVSALAMVPGFDHVDNDGTDRWASHNTAALVDYEFDDPDATRLTQQTNSLRGTVHTPVDPPVAATAMTITVPEVAIPTPGGPDTLPDFAISSIIITGSPA